MSEIAPAKKKSRGKSLLWGVAALAMGAFFLADFFIPDPIPFLDEIVAGLLTLFSGFKAVQGLFAREKA